MRGSKYRAGRWNILLFVAILLGISIDAPNSFSQQPETAVIRGTVLDAAGKPVPGALVTLKQMGHPDNATTTNSDGKFAFTSLLSGTYALSAEKSGLHSRIIPVTQASQTDIKVVLDADTLHSGASSSTQFSADNITFADKPNFTVAGITDWTAVGGHGSDSSLRTSESLAREASALKPELSKHNTSDLSGEGSANKSEEASLRAALVSNPNSFDANHQLGELYFHGGSFGEAIPFLEKAHRLDPSNRGNEYDLALACKATGNLAEARKHIQNLLAHEDKATLHRLLGELDEEMGDSLSAVHEDEQAVRLDPSEQNYFTWGSELLLHRAVWPAAEVFKKGTEAHPKSARMLAALGAALFASALYDEAALRLCQASDLNPADPAPYIFLGKIDIAAPTPLACVEQKLMTFVQESPGNARANYYYAMAIWKRHKSSESTQSMQLVEKLLTKAVTSDSSYDEAYLQLGNLFAEERNFEKAIGFYLKAIDANPQLGEAHYKLAVVYERTGESAKAKREFQLHDDIEKSQAAAVEQQRREVKQFLVVLQNQPAIH